MTSATTATDVVRSSKQGDWIAKRVTTAVQPVSEPA
jgi:hypothetical protein